MSQKKLWEIMIGEYAGKIKKYGYTCDRKEVKKSLL